MYLVPCKFVPFFSVIGERYLKDDIQVNHMDSLSFHSCGIVGKSHSVYLTEHHSIVQCITVLFQK